MGTTLLSLTSLLLALGCVGSDGAPAAPTPDSVGVDAIVGSWVFEDLAAGASSALQLAADGRYSDSAEPSGCSACRWTREGSALALHDGETRFVGLSVHEGLLVGDPGAATGEWRWRMQRPCEPPQTCTAPPELVGSAWRLEGGGSPRRILLMPEGLAYEPAVGGEGRWVLEGQALSVEVGGLALGGLVGGGNTVLAGDGGDGGLRMRREVASLPAEVETR